MSFRVFRGWKNASRVRIPGSPAAGAPPAYPETVHMNIKTGPQVFWLLVKKILGVSVETLQTSFHIFTEPPFHETQTHFAPSSSPPALWTWSPHVPPPPQIMHTLRKLFGFLPGPSGTPPGGAASPISRHPASDLFPAHCSLLTRHFFSPQSPISQNKPMKPKSALRSFLALAGSSLLADFPSTPPPSLGTTTLTAPRPTEEAPGSTPTSGWMA